MTKRNRKIQSDHLQRIGGTGAQMVPNSFKELADAQVWGVSGGPQQCPCSFDLLHLEDTVTSQDLREVRVVVPQHSSRRGGAAAGAVIVDALRDFVSVTAATSIQRIQEDIRRHQHNVQRHAGRHNHCEYGDEESVDRLSPRALSWMQLCTSANKIIIS